MSSATVLGLHGTRRRWVEATVRDGLIRPSAAWFMIGPGCQLPALATFAAAIYLGFGHSGQEALRSANRYADALRRQPELLPVLLVFADAPTGAEIRDRYVWLGSPGARRLTEPYTNVARAGRFVGPALPVTGVMRFGLTDIAEVEDSVDLALPDPSGIRLLQKVPSGTIRSSQALFETRMAGFCAALGAAARRRWPSLIQAVDC
jgi:hypothetical protein